MTSATLIHEETVEAAGRATVYTLLATGFALPTPATRGLLARTLIPGALGLELPNRLSDRVRDLATCVPTDPHRAREDHMALFPPITSQDAPGNETAYRGDGIFQQTTILADIAGFYRAHGLRAGGSARERLDHITVELEFMTVLARKQVFALEDGRIEDSDICRETASLFLSDHLGCWAPAFGRRAATVTASPWYRHLGLLLAEWVEADASASGVVPVEVVDEPLPPEPPDDGLCGPCPVPGEQVIG